MTRLQAKLETTYDGIWDTPHAFQYLSRFERLTAVLPISGMNNKYTRMISTFKKEIERTLQTFKKQTGNPPLVWILYLFQFLLNVFSRSGIIPQPRGRYSG